MTELPLNELCTDASSMIIKLVRDMKGNMLLTLLAKLLGLLLLRGSCLVSCCRSRSVTNSGVLA